MASSKKEAQNYLGSVNDYINLKGLNQERSLANDVYNTNTKSFLNEYNDLLNTLATNRSKAKTDFGSGRQTVGENAYMQNRNDLASLASRGLNGGIAQLNKIGNRIQTGRQYSDLANTYYNTMNELDANAKTYKNRYDTNMEGAKNTLNAALADISSREKASRNAYRTAVAQLAEQIQSRRDANANAAAARALARQQQNEATARYEKERLDALRKDLSTKTYEDAYKYLNTFYKDDIKDANAWLQKYTTLRPTQVAGMIGAEPIYSTDKRASSLPKTTTSNSKTKTGAKTKKKTIKYRGRGGGF